MALYPKATWRPVVGVDKDPPIVAVGVILHVRGGTGDSLFGYFNGPSGGIESHFYLNNKLDWEQYRDTDREADANYKGNSWVVDGIRYGFLSVETEGGANGAWSDGVIAELQEFLMWASTEHKFPLRKATGFHGTGVGYHVQFGAGLGLDAWSNAAGKVCPGPERIAQYYNTIVPWMNADPTPKADPPTPAHQEIDMFTAETKNPGGANTLWLIDGFKKKKILANTTAHTLNFVGVPARGVVLGADLAEFPTEVNTRDIVGDAQDAILKALSAILPAAYVGPTPEAIAAAVIAEIAS